MSRVNAVRIHKYGGPEELRYEEVEVGEPGPGEARVRHTAIGLNFTDIHHRTGRYPVAAVSARDRHGGGRRGGGRRRGCERGPPR